MTVLLVVIIILALGFDYINGFHDAANSVATIVSTRVLTARQAVIWAAAFNFVAFFIFTEHGVAKTISKTVLEPYITLPLIISGLIAAIIWNLLTWWKGIPSSSSHTLLGGLMGAAIAAAGFQSLNSTPIIKAASFILLAPMLGMLVAMLIGLWFLHSFRKALYPKFISLAIIGGMAFLVWSNLETKKDFLGGTVYTIQFDSEVKSDDLKKDFTFKDKDEKEFAPVVKPANDASGNPDQTKTLFTVKTNFLKKAGETTVDPSLTTKIQDGAAKTKVASHIVEAHRITESSPETERWDTSHLKSSFKSYWLKVVFHGTNFKWLLLMSIVSIVSIFTMFLSGMPVAKAERWFRRMQLVSSAAFCIGHGGNDAQKVMGIIAVALVAEGLIPDASHIPNWVALSCYGAIAMGTLSGGWKIIKTMGSKITKVTPFEGVVADTAGASILFLTENLSIPVSTTHTVTGSIMGAGSMRRLSAVRWGVTRRLLVAWIITIPISALMGATAYFIWSLVA
ncbi:MAG: inorganic phosphate transporter [Bacteroidia bacterium]